VHMAIVFFTSHFLRVINIHNSKIDMRWKQSLTL
jgi:hypothetical protein